MKCFLFCWAVSEVCPQDPMQLAAGTENDEKHFISRCHHPINEIFRIVNSYYHYADSGRLGTGCAELKCVSEA